MSTNFESRPDSTSLHVMLGQLQCPYQVEDQAMCSFYQREAFCPFGHRPDHALSLIPPYICVDHLVGKCTAEGSWRVSVEGCDDWLTRCSAGYHPTWTQMIDLEQLDRVVQEVAQQDQVQVDDEDELKCAICLGQMHSPYGLLEHCTHLFCAECIIVWEETGPQKSCPVCRVLSRRVLLWSSTEPSQNGQSRQDLFGLQARCIDLFQDGNQERNQEQERREQAVQQREQAVQQREEAVQQQEQYLQMLEQHLTEWKLRLDRAFEAVQESVKAQQEAELATEAFDRVEKRLKRYQRLERAQQRRQAEEAKPKLFKMFKRFLALFKSCFRRLMY